MADYVNMVLENGDARLNIHKWQPQAPLAVVHVNHGLAEHSCRYERFALALAESGIATYAHDHRGHGQTTAPGAELGLFGKGGVNAVIDDIEAVNRHIRKLHPELPVISFGHSMGSILAFNHALRHPGSMEGLALWNAGVDDNGLLAIYRILLKLSRYFRGSDTPSQIAKKLGFDAWNKKFAPNRTDFDWLSRDEVEVDKYIDDPLCGFDVSTGLWIELTDAIKIAADDANLAKLPKGLPVNLLGGEKDPCTEGGTAVKRIEQRMRSLEMEDVTFTLLNDTRHESLNEINRDETTASFIAWLQARFGG